MPLAAWDTTFDEGQRSRDQALEQQGYFHCPGKLRNGQPCDFWLTPQAKANIEQRGGYFTCPRCHLTTDLLDHLPWHGVEGGDQHAPPGGMTKIGIPMTDQAQIGENLIAQMKEIPGYGPITWWHPGGSQSGSPLDGATAEWGIEVKTLGNDGAYHRFNPGGKDPDSGRDEKQEKNDAAREMGLKGILGILVMLDYRRDVADVYIKEMPLETWQDAQGNPRQGIASFRKNTANQRLVGEFPFPNPYKDPSNPTPVSYNLADYYQSPPVILPGQSPPSSAAPAPEQSPAAPVTTQGEEMPF